MGKNGPGFRLGAGGGVFERVRLYACAYRRDRGARANLGSA